MLYSVKVNIQYYVKVYGKYKVSLNSMSKLILKLKMLIVKIISMLRWNEVKIFLQALKINLWKKNHYLRRQFIYSFDADDLTVIS